MRLEKVVIHNFRGIIDESFIAKEFTLLVGANNGGKSTVVDAIRAFYEKDGFKFKRERDWPVAGAKDEESWIHLSFICSPEEYDSLAEEYRIGENRLDVRKYFSVAPKEKVFKAGSIYGVGKDGKLSSDHFYGAKNVQQGKFGQVVYIPAVSRVDEHTKLTGPSALRDLLTNILEDVVESSSAFNDLRTHFSHFASSVKSEATADGRSLQSFEEDLTGMLSSWDASFQISIDSPKPADIIKNLVRYECVDQAIGKPQSADDFGSGFQRHFIFSLIRIAPKFISKGVTTKAKDFVPDFTLILFEEPEAFLHPPQQEILADSLRQLTNDSSRQVLCTTHSSHFVSKNSDVIPALVRLKRTDGLVSLSQVSSEAWKDILDSNQLLNQLPSLKKEVDDDDLAPTMESLKYFLWLNADRSTLFFANHVLLVEGPADQAIINRLVKDRLIAAPPGGVYVLDCLGKFNIHRFMGLLIRLSISHSVLHDEDEPNEKHEEVNQLIRDTADSELTYHIEALPKNLEVVLGIPSCRPHRKPQHVMYYYETGQIADDQLDGFCEMVGRCMPTVVSGDDQAVA
jgi:predicted ATP-dependent endonuclease of OLD family